MKRTAHFLPHDVSARTEPDGTVLLRSNTPLGPVARCTGDWVHHWAAQTPDAVFLAERSGAGWRSESYASTLQKVQALAANLLARGMRPQTPILILSGNSVDHGLLSLAAQYVGIPTVPVAEQYSLVEAAHGRLAEAVNMVRPHMAYVADAGQFDAVLRLDIFDGVELVATSPGRVKTTAFDTLLKDAEGAPVTEAHNAVTPQTIAKILMTSGSTSAPKGVLTTQKMLCTNQAQLVAVLPFLHAQPPRIVDWLPWNHVFGGSHNFNMMLANGGALYIDDGKPAPGLIDRTVENLQLMTGTLCFNVPIGFQLLLEALKTDRPLRHRFFENLDMLFYAGASLPQDVWQGFETMAMEIKGEVPLMTSSWGLTETAPATLLQQEPTDTSGVVGIPVPGNTIKMIPLEDARFEVRTKGDNVMTGYLNAPQKTAESFDADGYFITGDVMRFVDPDDPNRGLRFDGRLSEDFKLLSGTWVRAAQLRIDLLAALAPLAADLVITGADRAEIGVMIFPNRTALDAQGFDAKSGQGALTDAGLLNVLRTRLTAFSRGSGSSTRIARAMVLSEPASLPTGEMTAKGNLNFRKILTRRADLLTRLYAADDPAVITL